MAILPRNLLKSFFERGDKPNESQFGALIDSMLHATEDQAKLGLRVYETTRTYTAGEAVINNGSLYQALVTTTGVFNPSHWQKVYSLGSVTYQGTWDPINNDPVLVSGEGTKGDYYVVSASGTRLLDGNSTWAAGDEVIFNGAEWERVINADLDQQTAAQVSYSNTTSGLIADDVQEAIDEVDQRVDAVETSIGSLTTGNVAEDPASNLYYTDARVTASPAVTALESSVTTLQSTVAALPWESYSSIVGETARLDSSSYVGIMPNTNNGADLGISATRWRDLYIAGNIDFSSTLAVKRGSTAVATFHEEGLKVGYNSGSALPHLSVDPEGVAGRFYTMNNNTEEASVVGNYLPGSIGMAMMVTGSTYAGTGMLASSRSALISENHELNIGTSTEHDLSLWTNNNERLRISLNGQITNVGETAFNKRIYYLDGTINPELDWSRGNIFFTVLDADITFTFINEVNLQTITVGIQQGGAGGFKVTWPLGIKWPNGIVPTLTPGSGRTDVYTFVRMNEQTYGHVIQNFS